MPRPEFESTTIVAPRKRLEFINHDQTSTVAAGQSELVDIYADANTICKVIQLSLNAPAASLAINATSGVHRMTIGFTGSAGSVSRGENAYNAQLQWQRAQWEISSSQYPDSPEAQAFLMHGLRYDDTVGLRFTYTNDTNGAQESQRNYRLLIEKETIA